MSMMTARELFRNIMTFKTPDRIPFWDVEGILQQTERKWCRYENLPFEASAASLMGYDGHLFTFNFGDQVPLPAFVPKTLAVDDDYITKSDQFGFTIKLPKRCNMSPIHYVYVGAPLKTMEDWQNMKKRYNPLDKRRYPAYWGDELFAYYNTRSQPVTIGMNWGPARGIKNGYMFGFQRFMEVLIDEPKILKDMFEFWADFIIQFLDSFIHKLRVDAFYFKEDGMGYKNSTLVSPEMFTNFYKPSMQKVTEFLQGKGVSVIGYYSSGNLEPLLSVFLDIGINLIVPLECAAGMDSVKLRKQYGKELLMIGNISRAAIMKGKKEIEYEVMSKVPFLMEKGGYIPAFDDAIMPDISFENVKYCVELIKSIKL